MVDRYFEYSVASPRLALVPHLAAHGLHFPGNAEVNFRGTYAKVVVDPLFAAKLTLAKAAL